MELQQDVKYFIQVVLNYHRNIDNTDKMQDCSDKICSILKSVTVDKPLLLYYIVRNYSRANLNLEDSEKFKILLSEYTNLLLEELNIRKSNSLTSYINNIL